MGRARHWKRGDCGTERKEHEEHDHDAADRELIGEEGLLVLHSPCRVDGGVLILGRSQAGHRQHRGLPPHLVSCCATTLPSVNWKSYSKSYKYK